MKNADMPAMPNDTDIQTLGSLGFSGIKEVAEFRNGLTKREMFAMHALSSVLDKYNPYEHGDFDSSDYGETAKHAVGIADALLKELDKQV